MTNVSLDECISKSFYGLHHDIRAKKHSHYWLKGGRGSTKSSFVSIEIILGMMDDPNANAVVLRKVASTLRESVFDQLLWAIDKLGVSHLWKETISPMSIAYLETGQKIVFKGADKPRKIKSTKFRRGYTKFLWYEEVDEFNDYSEIRTINQSLRRGGSGILTFYSYNPPKTQKNWVNVEVSKQALRPNVRVHSSDYLSVNPDWLGQEFIIDAEYARDFQPKVYEHEYLGIVTGTDAEVFNNLVFREVTDEEIATFDTTYRGLDFGFAADPLHYMENYYDSTRKRLVIYYEIHKVGLKNNQAVDEIKRLNPLNQTITADSAEPRTISEFRDLGLNIQGAKKGPGSIEHGIKFLQDMKEIIIDRGRAPNTAREFENYEIERDRQGNLKGNFPDKNNHSIDTARYSLESVMKPKVKIKTYKF